MAVTRTEQAWETEARALAALAGHPLLARQDHLALAEAPGSPWFDALGNALALEALSHPLLAACHAPLCAGIEAFLDALTEGGALRRRAGPRGLAIRSDDPRRLHIETPSHVFTGDLRRGELVQALRADPGRPVARHTGNMVSFRLGGREHTVDVEDSVADCGVLREAGGARVFHESRIAGRGRFRWRDRAVGTLRYDYTIRADTPVLGLRVTFVPAPGAAPENLVLSTALDAMSPEDAVCFRRATLDGVACDAFAPGAAPVLSGPARAIAFHQGGAPARALAIHLRPGDPAALQSLTVTGDAAGRAHWALLRHAGRAVAEERLVLAGEPRADVAALFARMTPERGRDVSLCAAPAMVALALASRNLWGLRAGDALPGDRQRRSAGGAASSLRSGPVIAAPPRGAAGAAPRPVPAGDRGDEPWAGNPQALRHWLDALHDAGDDPACLVLAEDACARAGLHACHGAALDRLLASGGEGPIALLALARATTLRPDDARLAPAIARCIVRLHAAPPDGDFDRAWLLRALRAVQAAQVVGALALTDDARACLASLVRREAAWLAGAPTGSTALRAALLLARLAPDALVMHIAPAGAAA